MSCSGPGPCPLRKLLTRRFSAFGSQTGPLRRANDGLQPARDEAGREFDPSSGSRPGGLLFVACVAPAECMLTGVHKQRFLWRFNSGVILQTGGSRLPAAFPEQSVGNTPVTVDR